MKCPLCRKAMVDLGPGELHQSGDRQKVLARRWRCVGDCEETELLEPVHKWWKPFVRSHHGTSV